MNTEKKEKPTVCYPVVVEGKYDKAKLSSLFEAQILITNGFGVFKDREKRALFLRLAQKSPIIVFTDSDSGGMLIRKYFKNLLPADRQIHLYVPPVKGKEKRKSSPSKEGLLGVEGSDSETIRKLFAPYVTQEGVNIDTKTKGQPLSRREFYERGYSGEEHSAEKRRRLCQKCALPENLSSAALLEALNLLYSREELEKLL